MPVFRIMLQGLDAKDASSLKSMLGLSVDLLNHEWKIVEQAPADLSIYSFDTEQGRHAWSERSEGITAVLTSNGNITETVDIVLKKPLRTSNFSNALNLVDDMLSASAGTNPPAESAIAQQQSPETETTAKTSFFTSLATNLSSRWKNKNKLATDGLMTSSPLIDYQSDSDTITNPDLLKAWLEQLPQEPSQRNITLLAYLDALNRKHLSVNKRMTLLEHYFDALKPLFFNRDINTIKHEYSATTDSFKTIRAFRAILEQLMLGYKLIIDELLAKSKPLTEQSPALLAINRATEITGLHILHAYQHYHPVPSGDLGQLHQFYLYLETRDHLHTEVTTKQGWTAPDFFSLYVQILLTGIADPYGLDRFDILRLFNLIRKFTDKVEIEAVNAKHIHLTSDFLLSGHFCLDCSQDKLPTAMSRTAIDIRKAESSRLMNIQPVLLALETLFKKITKPAAKVSLDLDLQLLEKITPKLNTTYERKFHRLPSVKNRSVQLARGIEASYRAISGKPENTLEWAIVNQGSEGMMICRPSENNHLLDIHDLVSIFEKDLPAKLAIVRWLVVDMDDLTQAGLELITTSPLNTASVMPQGQAEEYPALIISAKDPQEASVMITKKGLYSPKRQLRVKMNDNLFNAVTGKVIDATLDYEQFSYTTKPGS